MRIAIGPPGEWVEQAICTPDSADLFFPDIGGAHSQGKRICQGCPVRAQCLNHALAHDERIGIWGGLSEHERNGLKGVRA